MKKKDAIQDHVLLMKHVVLSEEASEKILKKYNIDKKQLPVIFHKDPALAGTEAEPGDLVEINRDSPTAKYTKYYRVVVNA